LEDRVVKFIPLNPQTVTIEADAREPRFVVKEGGGNRVLHFREVLHIPAFGGAARSISPVRRSPRLVLE
jgi:hypothetical protein